VTADASGFVALTPEGMARTSQDLPAAEAVLPVCFRAPQLLWCAPISDGQLAIAAQSIAGPSTSSVTKDIVSIGKFERVG